VATKTSDAPPLSASFAAAARNTGNYAERRVAARGGSQTGAAATRSWGNWLILRLYGLWSSDCSRFGAASDDLL